MRKTKFINNEYYHIYNRGVDKRLIFDQQNDLDRFFESMKEFNTMDPIGSIYENHLVKNRNIKNIKQEKKFGGSATKLFKNDKLVKFICYCLNPNHYHFILQQIVDKGIQKFMHKLGGYTEYFNEKYKRSGSLFQGRYKAIHINSNEYLLHLSAYVNLNYKVHNLEKFGGRATKLFQSSWDEYISNNGDKSGKSKNNKNNSNNALEKDFCEKKIILDQFENATEYKKFAEDSLKRIKENKQIKFFLLE